MLACFKLKKKDRNLGNDSKDFVQELRKTAQDRKFRGKPDKLSLDIWWLSFCTVLSCTLSWAVSPSGGHRQWYFSSQLKCYSGSLISVDCRTVFIFVKQRSFVFYPAPLSSLSIRKKIAVSLTLYYLAEFGDSYHVWWTIVTCAIFRMCTTPHC